MAGWNGSGGGSSPQKPKVTAKKPSPARGMIAGLLVVAVAVGCYFAFFSEAEKPKKEKVEKRTTTIKEVKPAAAPTNKVEVVKEKPIDPNARPTEVGQILNGYIKLPSGRLHKILGEIVNSAPKSESEIYLEKTFPQRSDRAIADMLMTQPGETLIGDDAMYYRTFTEDFKQSLLSPIEYDKNDDKSTRELKMAVAAARQELIDCVNRGEDPAQAMIETRKQYRELGLYREDIKTMVREQLKDGELTPDDYESLVKAANTMLEDRGSKPLDLPETFKHYARMLGDEVEDDDETADKKENETNE